jgi:hypothetical protein
VAWQECDITFSFLTLCFLFPRLGADADRLAFAETKNGQLLVGQSVRIEIEGQPGVRMFEDVIAGGAKPKHKPSEREMAKRGIMRASDAGGNYNSSSSSSASSAAAAPHHDHGHGHGGHGHQEHGHHHPAVAVDEAMGGVGGGGPISDRYDEDFSGGAGGVPHDSL